MPRLSYITIDGKRVCGATASEVVDMIQAMAMTDERFMTKAAYRQRVAENVRFCSADPASNSVDPSTDETLIASLVEAGYLRPVTASPAESCETAQSCS